MEGTGTAPGGLYLFKATRESEQRHDDARYRGECAASGGTVLIGAQLVDLGKSHAI